MNKLTDKKTISIVLNRKTYDELVSYCEKNETKIIYFAPVFLIIILKLFKISKKFNDLEYRIIVPIIIINIPKY